MYGSDSAYSDWEEADSFAPELIRQLPERFRAAVEDGFSDADDDIRKLSVGCVSGLAGVRSTMASAVLSGGSLEVPCSHFNPDTVSIYMEEDVSGEEYMRVFRHEYGHFVDHYYGQLSSSPEFTEAFMKDAALYNKKDPEGRRHLQQMQTDIADNIHAFASENVTDIISSLTHNDVGFIIAYAESAVQTSANDPLYEEKMDGVGMMGHDTEYWDHGPYLAQQKEVFAELYAVWTENNPIVREFVQEHFPHLCKAFQEIITREAKTC